MAITNKDIEKLKEVFATKEELNGKFGELNGKFKEMLDGQDRMIKELERAREDRTLAIGAGQMSRVDSVKLAVSKSRSKISGCVMASDAFFPFRDSVDEAAKVGGTAIIQPGGSVKDEEVIAAANEHNIAMVFTGIRHFKH